MMNMQRVRQLNSIQSGGTGPVIYWMSRDQRAVDNWALCHAGRLARDTGRECRVVFSVVDAFLEAGKRGFDFMIKGLKEVEAYLHDINIPFHLVPGEPSTMIPQFVNEIGAGVLITDFDPLRIKQRWTERITRQIDIPFLQVDTHNIVPCWEAYPKAAYGAHILRKRIMNKLPEFLVDFPEPPALNQSPNLPDNDWKTVEDAVDRMGPPLPVAWCVPGTSGGMEMLREFIDMRLDHYSEYRNDPVRDGQSDLSPWLHFGQIAPQRAALEIQASGSPGTGDALEQLIVRRELSDNYCYYVPDYDRVEGFPEWAKSSLEAHAGDPREAVYTREEFESAETHDRLWNAAQKEMMIRGKMHGYMRMYWAKKILEWSPGPKQALETAVYLNDHYSLDGRDPNGYAGISWSIGGRHDRPWFERPIFGKIRYMSFNGAARKFDIEAYIRRVNALDSRDGNRGKETDNARKKK